MCCPDYAVHANNSKSWPCMAMDCLATTISWMIGMLDHLVGFAAIILSWVSGVYPSCQLKLGSKGFGDVNKPIASLQAMRRAIFDENKKKLKDYASLDHQSFQENVLSRWFGIEVLEVTFDSPAAHLLPAESKRAHCWKVEPWYRSHETSNVTIIHLPGTGEAHMFPRIFIAWFLAIFRGWTSLLVTFPLYGPRKPDDQTLFFFSTIELGITQHQALVQEAAALIRHTIDSNPDTHVCITGFSIGGGMSIYSAGLALLAGVSGSKLSICSYAGAMEPACVIQGQFAHLVDWQAIEKYSTNKHKVKSVADAKERTLDYLRETTRIFGAGMQTILETGKNTVSSIRLVGMHHDGFIPKEFTIEMNRVATDMLDETGNVRESWIWGGHIMAAMVRPYFHTWAILDAVDSVQTTYYSGCSNIPTIPRPQVPELQESFCSRGGISD